MTFLKEPSILQQEIKSSIFVHSGKSLSVCEYVDSTICLLVYRGNALEGSSGGAIYDEIGKFWGISFGYIADETEEDEPEHRS